MSRKASTSSGGAALKSSHMTNLVSLYPFVDENKTPLPSRWNHIDKYTFIGISHDNLRVTYRGQGKTHKDAAAVRSNHPIPTACGLYYFEVKIVSKGRDGYMGIGLCQKDVSMNRLPGWDTFSYGYHGDDGNSFCSSGAGTPYGPTFTTNDVIGCALNLVDRTCFYTKNGHNLGIAFRDVVGTLYPTVGLQTPNEVVDTNFGEEPFVYDIRDDMQECQLRVTASVAGLQLPANKTEWLNKLVSSYLVHHGLYASASAFNQSTGLQCEESSQSIFNRRTLHKLIVAGKITEAVSLLNQLHPNLLESNKLLLFTLKCRQFVEMVVGVENDIDASCSSTCSPSCSPPHKTSAFAPPYSKSKPSARYSPRTSPRRLKQQSPRSGTSSPNSNNGCGPTSQDQMECSSSENGNASNGTTWVDSMNGNTKHENGAAANDDLMDVESNPVGRIVSEASRKQDEAQIQTGRDLFILSAQIRSKSPAFLRQEKIMNDGFALIAYPRGKSVIGVPERLRYLFEGEQRESVARAVNSAVLQMNNQACVPALEVLFNHNQTLRHHMANSLLGACAFMDVNKVLPFTQTNQ